MANRSSKQSDLPATAAALVAGLRLTPQMLMMFRAFLGSPQRTKLLLLGVAIVATAFSQVRLNAWNQPFYDALAHKDLRGFLDQLKVFGVIACGLLVLNVAQAWLNQTTKVKLREWLVCDLFDEPTLVGSVLLPSLWRLGWPELKIRRNLATRNSAGSLLAT